MAATLEALAYSIARGCTRAYLDVLAERKRAEEEKPNDADHARALRFRDAVERVRSLPAGDPGPDHPASGSDGK